MFVHSLFDALYNPFLEAGLLWLGRRRLPRIAGTLGLPALQEPVEVARDRWGVPHIYAESTHDLFFAQGFVHAQDRFWQMELNRRIGRGTLSELFGERALEVDRVARTLGFRRIAESDWTLIEPAERAALEAYSEGVNAYLAQHEGRYPLEFRILRTKPGGSWSPIDSLVFIRFMLWSMSFGWYSEIVRTRLRQTVGPERAGELDRGFPPPANVSSHGREAPDESGNRNRKHDLAEDLRQHFSGSNAWAVSPNRSNTGHALLANDPHLPLRLPSVWYENHLSGGEYEVTGVSFPGTPGVIIGHNGRIAWGITVAFTDAQDLFLERFDPHDPRRYATANGWAEAEVRREEITVRGRREPHMEAVVHTVHGPVVPQISEAAGQPTAISAASLRSSPDFGGFLAIDRARNWDEFTDAIRRIRAAQLNVLYADVEGNIGHRVTGAIPIRSGPRGDHLREGWTGRDEWQGEIPAEAMPFALNPDEGIIVNANDKIVADGYPHDLGNAWANGFRALRIRQMIEEAGVLDLNTCQRIQLDVTSLPGRVLVDRLQGLELQEADAALALELLRAWDGELRADSVGGCVYEVARTLLFRRLLEPEIGEELTRKLMGDGLSALLSPESEYFGHDIAILLRLLTPSPEGSRPDRRERDRLDAVVAEALSLTTRWLRRELGRDPSRWHWGRLHVTGFPHVLGRRRTLGRLLGRGPYPVGGDADTPCQHAHLPSATFQATSSGPSHRQIIDLGDFDRSVAIFAPGQSGNLGSPHYDDLIAPWRAGEYHPMPWSRHAVKTEEAQTLWLAPPGKG